MFKTSRPAFLPITRSMDKIISRFFPDDPDDHPGFGLPWGKCRSIRFAPAELSLWTGINGHGKSCFLNQVMLEAMLDGQRVFLASFEMTSDRNGMRLVRQALGRVPETPDDVVQAVDWLGDKLVCNAFTGKLNYKDLLSHMAEFVKEGCTQFVIDSLMKCGIPQDDFSAITDFIDRLQDFAQTTTAHVHLVAHSRKLGDEDDQPGKMDVKGPMEVTNLPDNVFGVWRNKAKEQSKKVKFPFDAVFECHKSRELGSEVEKAYGLYYHHASMQYLEQPTDKPRCYCHADLPF